MTNKGILSEIQRNNQLIDNFSNYYSFLWKDVPQKYICKLKLNNLSNDNLSNDTLTDDIDENYQNDAIDIGCDILMVNKSNDDDCLVNTNQQNNSNDISDNETSEYRLNIHTDVDSDDNINYSDNNQNDSE